MSILVIKCSFDYTVKMLKITDLAIREQALDPTKSFIIQAPAGSGKTELLTRRLLSLLATVESPDQVLALTFTRKAASEMRERLIEALVQAQGEKPESDTGRYALAQRVLAHSEHCGWDLINNPNRLRIGTIDAWCHYLVGQMPLLAKFGCEPQVCDDPYPLYRRAAENCLNHVYKKTRWQTPMCTLLSHLDNRHEYALELFIDMLAKREQWLDIVVSLRDDTESKARAKATLETIFLDQISRINSHFPEDLKAPISTCLNFAASNIDQTSTIRAWQDPTFPDIDISHENKWRALAEVLLTKQNTYRKRIDKSIGFPAKSAGKDAQEKKRFAELKENFSNILALLSDNELLREHLFSLNHIPSHETEVEWEVIEAILNILPLLVAECQLIFKQSKQVDFIEIALRANHALGAIDEPSELALRIDSQLQHILVDEFQDTSYAQLQLLTGLTKGWDQGRTLFLVGDPMQSIYRFRQADVGIFLQVQQHGIGSIQCQPLSLTTNFRSQANLIDWVNQQFKTIFPTSNDPKLGAITYSQATPLHPGSSDIHYHRALDPESEAQTVIDIIKTTRQNNPDYRIGILVRARSHLSDISLALQQAGLDYHATELESLAFQPVIQDLLALTRACHHLADRVAWLSLLRAPWCGLSLDEIFDLCHGDEIVWSQLQTATHPRAQFLKAVMQQSLARKQSSNLRDWIEQTWRALGAPNYLSSQEIAHAKQFFNLLESYDVGGLIVDMEDFERRLNSLFADNQSQASIEVMTIHKSKGLEFDCVILPGLNKRPRGDDHRLFYWYSEPAKNQLLIAPIPKPGQADPVYEYLRIIEKQKDRYEQARLFYVAITRARHDLHLCYHVDDIPAKSSNLGLLWPQLENQLNQEPSAKQSSAKSYTPTLKRVTQCPELSPSANAQQTTTPWQSPIPSITGDFCHRILCQITQQGLEKWQALNISDYYPAWTHALLTLGCPASDIESSLDIISRTITNICQDEMGQYILSPHVDAHSEYALMSRAPYLKTAIIDRTFVDQGVRWIIDYKITWQAEREPYQAQLEHYAELFSKMDGLPIKLGLYFPLAPSHILWEPI